MAAGLVSPVQTQSAGSLIDGRDKNYKSGFKKPGKDGMGIYRAVLISGPPGIGKTTSAHLMAQMAGYNPIELNASDARSKKLVEVSRRNPSCKCGLISAPERNEYRQCISRWLLPGHRTESWYPDP